MSKFMEQTKIVKISYLIKWLKIVLKYKTLCIKIQKTLKVKILKKMILRNSFLN